MREFCVIMWYMKTIGVRELRQHASRWLRRVAEGETYEITVRGMPVAGMPVARLSPVVPPGGALERLVDEGLVNRAGEGFDEAFERLGPPIVISSEVPSSSERLTELRRDER